MNVIKVVDLVTRKSDQLSLHFSDFSTNLYGIYKFAVFENKRKRKGNLASRPLDFYFFSLEVLSGRESTEEGRAAVFRRGSAPAARGKLGKGLRGLVRTCGWWFGGSGWSVVVAPRRAAGRRRTEPRRRRSGEVWRGRPGWEGSAGPGGVEALGGTAQRRVSAARGEQQLVDGGMARERARKQRERVRTRRAQASVSRGESISIPRLDGEGPEVGLRR